MVNVALVGTGAIAGRHIKNLRQIRSANISAVCDPNQEALSLAQARTGARGYGDLGEMLSSEKDLDAAYICTPIRVHGEIEERLAERGIHLFVEKPLPPEPSIIERVERAIRKSGVLNSVGYHWRYGEATDRAAGEMDDREVGMVLGLWMTGLPGQAWWSKRSQNPAQIFEQTTHLFDLSRFLVGEVEEVSSRFALRCMGDVSELEDVSIVSMRFVNGAIGAMCSTYMISYKHPGPGLGKWLSSGNPLLRKFAWGTHHLGLWNLGHDTRSFRIELMVVMRDLVLQIRQGSLIVTTGRKQREYRSRTDPYLLESTAFIEAVASGDSALIRSSYTDATITHDVVMSAIRSASEGRPIQFEQV